jgi:hypothetical protein
MLKLKIDPWSSDYGPSLHLDDNETKPEVQLDLEGEWKAHDPEASEPLKELALVDGVRRMELNLRLEDEARSMKAAIGTLGCGALVIRPGYPQSLTEALRHADIHAYLLVDAPDGPTLPDLTTVAGASDLMMALQNKMRECEAILADRVSEEVDLVIADGPLQNTHSLKHEVLGYIKSQHQQLLERKEMDLVRQLQPGQRTPIFSLGSDTKYHRLSWYLRLDHPAQDETVLAGIVRLEMDAQYGLQRAQQRANQVGRLLPPLKNSRHRDPRSPQNLIPIAVLERAVRHRLGDPALRQRNYRKLVLGAEL